MTAEIIRLIPKGGLKADFTKIVIETRDASLETREAVIRETDTAGNARYAAFMSDSTRLEMTIVEEIVELPGVEIDLTDIEIKYVDSRDYGVVK